VSETINPEDDIVASEDEPARPVAMKTKRLHHHLIEWAVLLSLALTVTIGLRSFAFQTFYIPSSSMAPTLQEGDRIIVDKLAVDWGTIHRGDILVFHSPPQEECAGTHDPVLVKRVIGLPGDSLYSVGNTIYVNDQPLKEAWPHTEPLGPPAIAPKSRPVVVGARHYFMMGDNHFYSCDSRYWGTITRADVIGKALVRVWPIGRVGNF
jgi:signal peptidase I